ncbi:hypothetical protein DFH29DRAFT_61721 [Suillus ampliporus]|nr:hypothetical protein DFH29DRAFT_61721 [Suillus ampliporus]
MDPITSGLTILQVVQTIAQASALLYGYVAAVRDADSSCRDLLDVLSSIGGVLTTVMEIEKDASLPDNLRGALSRLMTNGPVAKLQVELNKLLPNEQENRKMGMIDKLKWPFEEKEVAVIVDKLKEHHRDITAILEIDAWIILKEVEQSVKEVDRGVQELTRVSDTQREARIIAWERQKLLEWMNPVPCTAKHDASRRQRNAETGRWIFQADEYVAWNTSDCGFLWLNGQPGSGKTILASAVIDEMQGGGQAGSQTLAYFYCDFRDEDTTVAVAVLRSLVVQLLQQSTTEEWVTKTRARQQRKSDAEDNLVTLRKLRMQQHHVRWCPADLGVLRDLLVEASKLVSRPVLVIDALDECKDHRDLLGYLVTLAEDARLRLFVTSRIEPDIKDTLHIPTVSLMDKADKMQDDIRVHITEQLKTQKRLSRLPEMLRTMILEKLLEKAKGMFRWVQCQLDVIMDCKRHVDIEMALDNLPAGLYETYDRIIRAIQQRGPDNDQIAQSCLLWLTGTFTSLTLDQLNEAMMIEVGRSSLNPNLGLIDPMDIVVACGSLVAYDEATGIVALSHYTVKEYLIGRRPNHILKSIPDMHARICRLLITYLLCDSADKALTRAEQRADSSVRCRLGRGTRAAPRRAANSGKGHPLLSYAVGLLTHLGHVSDEDPCLMAALSELIGNQKRCRVLVGQTGLCGPSIRHEGLHWSSVRSLSPLFIPILLGTPWMVEFLVKQQPHLLDVDIAPGVGSPLAFTIALRPDLLSILLKLGVDLNKPSHFNCQHYMKLRCYLSFRVPISWAVENGREVAVDFLLSQTEVNLPDDILHMAILHVAFQVKTPVVIIIGKLCQRGANVNFTVDGSTPIHTLLLKRWKSSDERLQTVKALVQLSCDLSVQDWTGRTALHIALDRGLEDIITYLLRKNAQLSGTATLQPDMWSWAQDKKWFAKVQAAALAADQPCTRIKGKVIETTRESQLVEFPGAVTAAHEDPNPICAVVVSATLSEHEGPIPTGYNTCKLWAELLRDTLSLQKFTLEWMDASYYQRVSSRLFDYHQGDEVTRMLLQLVEDKDSPGASLFLQMRSQPERRFGLSASTRAFPIGVETVEYTLDIYRGPVH